MKHGFSLTAVLALCLLVTGARGAESKLTALAQDSETLTVLRDGQSYLEISYAGWGPEWSYLNINGELSTDGDDSILRNQARVNTGAELTLNGHLRQRDERTLRLDTSLESNQDTALQFVIVQVKPHQPFEEGKAIATLADGSTREQSLPLGRGVLGDAVKSLALEDGEGNRTTLRFEPAMPISFDGDARIILAESLEEGQTVRSRMAIEFPEAVTFFQSPEDLPAEPGSDDWYVFDPSDDHDAQNEISMQGWLEAPAGKHGRVLAEGDQLMYNGEPVKFWGINLCYSACSPPKELAEKRAAFYAKYGINAVRLHKYADGTGWAGIQSEQSFVEFDEDALDRMDYFVAKLKERGIYVKLSSTFGVKLGHGDRDRVPYLEEFGELGDADNARVNTRHGSIYLSKELQDLQIEQVVKLLNHRNPYTGMTYAEDPAIMTVELFNEDSALFGGTLGQLQRVPSLRERAGEMFTNWLRDKYGNEESLVAAWGERAINSFGNENLTGESFEDNTIVPAGNPWFYDPDQLEGTQAHKKERLLDTMRFLYELQNDFYGRYEDAIREAGYEGEIIASNWQAGRAFSHFYNLHSDAMIGMIDRHNYFGGGSGGEINDNSMLDQPGGGMLSSGMQQVAGKPFMLSEWIHVYPNEWGVEGPAIIGAYGMGLQGWDVSFMFQNRDQGEFSERIGRERWDVVAPQVIGVFPAVARQVLRNDVSEADEVAPRYVHIPSLAEGSLGFEDEASQDADIKTFGGDEVPVETLAVARTVVDFVDSPKDTPSFDLESHVEDDTFKSTTSELAWAPGEGRHDGYIEIDTPATQALVGFAQGQTAELTDVKIASDSPFAAIYVSAKDPETTIADSDSVLITAIARARNTGMKIVADRLAEQGEGPIRMEPVKARITFKREGATVHVLDQAGQRTGETLPVNDGVVEIDGARDETPYYLVTFGE